jgi:hypothetical protein
MTTRLANKIFIVAGLLASLSQAWANEGPLRLKNPRIAVKSTGKVVLFIRSATRIRTRSTRKPASVLNWSPRKEHSDPKRPPPSVQKRGRQSFASPETG